MSTDREVPEQKYQEQTTDRGLPKPIYPLRHEFVASLDQYLHQTGVLIDMVGQLLELNAVRGDRVRETLREHYEKCQRARMGG